MTSEKMEVSEAGRHSRTGYCYNGFLYFDDETKAISHEILFIHCCL